MAKEFKEKTITINLSKVFEKPTTKRATGAKHVICKKVEKETRLKEFKISNQVNETLWSRGKYSSPRKITIKIIKDKNMARIMLPSEKYIPKEAKTTRKPLEKKEEPVLEKTETKKEVEKKETEK